MVANRSIDEIWHAYDSFEFPEIVPEEKICIYAQRYREWAEKACRRGLDSSDVAKIHEVMLLNMLKYFEFRGAVPSSHRNVMSERGHICIWHVFETHFNLLKLRILSLPQHTTLLLPAPPPPPAAETAAPTPEPQFQGIYLGKDLGHAFE